MTEIAASPAEHVPVRSKSVIFNFVRRHPTFALGGGLLFAIAAVSIAAPLLTSYDPIRLDGTVRMHPPSAEHLFGTDSHGRDVFARTLYGGRVSLVVGVGVALLSMIFGCVIGVITGFVRRVDAIVMRVMDALMAIPGILLAIALMALTRESIWLIIVAIAIPEIPHVVRLIRSVVLSIREQPYIQAAEAVGTRFPRILFFHVLPNAIPPLIVQATYICAAAVLAEAYLSFLGVGTPPEIPSWGNIIAESRTMIQLGMWGVLFPSCFLAVMVFAVNMLGDGLRDMLDPRMARRI
ncbi:ABC transporter permease [Pseudochelatococcus sp. B33]